MIDTSNIFGLQVNYGSGHDILKNIESLVASKEPAGVAFMNSHMIYEAFHDRYLHEGLNRFKYVFPDGVPLRKAISFIHHLKTDRIAGNDMIFFLLDLARRKGLSVTFYGGNQSTLECIRVRLSSEYSAVRAQLISPPFRSLSHEEKEIYNAQIMEFNPDILLVGLGCPKQEKWIFEHLGKLQCAMFGLGGAFALFAGVDTRAPLWMRNLSLEWLYRLSLEPGRLWKRYLITNSYFIFLFLREFWRVRIRGK